MKYRRPVVRMTAATLLAAALLSSAGCDNSDSIQAELDRAEIVLNALSTPGSTARPTDARKRDDLQWVIERLNGRPGKGIAASLVRAEDFDRKLDDPAAKPKAGLAALPDPSGSAVDSDDSGAAAAANTLVSRAQSGLAEIQANAHGQVEAALLNQLAVIRAALGEWHALNSQAAGLENYDAEADVRGLQAQVAQRQTELAAAQRAKKEADDKIAALEAQAAQLSAQGQTVRDRETTLRDQMVNASQTERLRLLEESMLHRREADDLDKQASTILARAAADRPEAATLGGRVSLIESQLRFLNEGIANVRERGEKNRAAAAQARAGAAQVATRLDTLITEAASLRANADAPADEAVRLYGLAQAAASKAASKGDAATKAQASGLGATAAQAAGDVQGARARGLAQYAQTVKAVAENAYPLPNQAAYAQRAAEAEKKGADSLELARRSYETAKGLFSRMASGGGGATGDLIRARLKSIDDKLNALAGNATPTAVEDGTASAGSGENPTADAPDGAVAAGDEATIAEARAFLQGLMDQARARNFGSVMEAMAFEDPAEAEMARSIFPLVQSVGSFNELCTTTYGSDLAALVQASSVPAVKMNPILSMIGPMLGQMGSMGAGLGDLADLDASELTFTVRPDGKVSFLGADAAGAAAESSLLAKVDGAWKMWIPKTGMAEGPSAQGMQMFLPMLKPMAGVFDSVGAKIASGGYENADAMLTDLAAKLMGAMSMPGMDGGEGAGDAGGEDAPIGGGAGGPGGG